MPNYLKAIISLVVALAAGLTYYAEILGAEVALALGALMIFAIWLFPEASGGKGS